jgi:hypothetical protein
LFVFVEWKEMLDRAAVYNHPVSVWMTKWFAERDVKTREEARQVFLEYENDPRALCFAAILVWPNNDELRRAADLGDGYAQALLAGRTGGQERFVAEKAAAQGERVGFYLLGACFQRGTGCEKDLERAKENYLVAAELGHIDSMQDYSRMLEKTDPRRYVWLSQVALNGDAEAFLRETEEHLQKFNSQSGKANVVFAIGQILKDQIDLEKRSILARFDRLVRPANQAVHFYNFQLRSYREAVDCWTCVAWRNNVVKDICNMIGKMIWNAREEAEYELNCDEGCECAFCAVPVRKSSSDEEDEEEEENLDVMK